MTAEEIKAVVASYWRYVKQCPVVALEVDYNLETYSGGERADVLAVNKNRFLIETEVKVTLADLKRDAKKKKHRGFSSRFPVRGITKYFYFAVPQDIANDAKLICADTYPYAGVLALNSLNELLIMVYREAKPLTSKRLTYPQVLRIIFSQSSTVCRLATKVGELTRIQKSLNTQLKEYQDIEKLKGD